MAGVLDILRRAVAEGGPELNLLRRSLGERYTQMAHDTPGMLTMGTTPATSPRDIARKYGVLVDPVGDPSKRYQPFPSVATSTAEYPLQLWTAPAMREQVGDAFNQLAQIRAEGRDIDPDVRTSMQQLADFLPILGQNGRGAVIKAMDSRIGSGTGKQLYPAAVDLAQTMGATVLPDFAGLTAINQWRRNLNSIPQVIRHGRNDVIWPDQTQLPFTKDSSAAVATMSPEEQVGTYLINSALQTPKHLADPLNYLRRLPAEQQTGEGDRQFLNRFTSLGDLDWLRPGVDSTRAQWGPLSAEADPAVFKDVTGQLRGMGAARVGDASLRNMFITDALSRGAPINPDLLQGVGYSVGGLAHLR